MSVSRLGTYEIVIAIGAGEMGEVYKARDTKLGRDVAIKILPDAFAHDEDRLARFEREARVLAALNHPNIASIYGLEDIDGQRFLVLELVPGETLSDLIAGGRQLALDRALAMAHQIADALEAAHARGVIHRDLKPANIKITPTGQIKVLDFGLAKALDRGEGKDQQATTALHHHATETGLIMGTAAYMSPEQTRGQAVDERTDIWAFGCVLYELLTG